MNQSTINDKEIEIHCRLCNKEFKKLESEGASICYECYKNEKVQKESN